MNHSEYEYGNAKCEKKAVEVTEVLGSWYCAIKSV